MKFDLDTFCRFPSPSKLELDPLRNFVRNAVIPKSRECDTTEELPVELLRTLHEMGWMQAFIPVEHGGVGAGTADLILLSRELAYGSPGIFTSTGINVLALSPILLYGSPMLIKKVCGDFARRFSLCSYAMTEPDTGSQIAQMRTRARRVEGGYVLNGSKCFITNANHSEHIVTFARIEGSDPEKPVITCFYLPGNSPGLTRGKPLQKLGQRDSNTAELHYDELFVPTEHRIGAEGQGMQIAFRALQRSKTLISAAAVGIALRASELVTEHLENRVLYGKPLIEQPAIHHQLAQLHTELCASWLLTCNAAAAWDAGQFAVLEASMAKMYNSDMVVRFVNEALELFGGYGFTREFEIEKLFRDSKVLEIYEGPTLVQQVLIARELFPSLKAADSAKAKKKAA